MIQDTMSEQDVVNAIRTLTHSVNGTNARLDKVIKLLTDIDDSVSKIQANVYPTA